MFDGIKNIDITKCSDSELKVLIRQALPVLFMACQRVLNDDQSAQAQISCKNCDKRNSCDEPCEMISTMLDGERAGSYIFGKHYGDLIDKIQSVKINDVREEAEDGDGEERPIKPDCSYLKAIDKIRADDIFTLYKNCSIIFSECEWRVATLKIRDGLTFKKISQITGVALSSASETFYRAKRKMEQHYKNKTRKKA